MPPRELASSSLGFQYPKNRDVSHKNVDIWLEDKEQHDGAEGFWRIHDDLYDLNSFMDVHPGGRTWLELTKGTDITEVFETHHISTTPEIMLKHFHVRKAATKRHSPYTFEPSGLYRTVKKNMQPVLETLPKNDAWKSTLITDCLVLGTFAFSVLACVYSSFLLTIPAGILLCWTTIAAHNYFHKKDNFRMYYFDLSLMSSRDWRISHVLSHHMLTNSIYDLEISLLEPNMEYLPTRNKKYISLLIAPFACISLFHRLCYKRLTSSAKQFFAKNNLIPCIMPLVMFVLGGQSMQETILMWTAVVCVGSFQFGIVGVNVGHHHPDVFHDGDAVRGDKDWGLMQLDTVIDRKETYASPFFGLTNFGDHALHHFFPTLDHGTLQHLYPMFNKTLKEFGIELRISSQLEVMRGQFQQLLKDKPNETVPDLQMKLSQ